MVSIAESTLRSNVFETVYDLVSTTLSSSTMSPSGVTVTAAFIDNTDTLPQVVVHPVDVDYESFTYDKSFSERTVRVLIDIWTKKNKDKDQICDALVPVLLSPSNYVGMHIIGVEESNAFEDPNNNKVHLKSIALSFRR